MNKITKNLKLVFVLFYCVLNLGAFAKIPVSQEKKIRLTEHWSFYKGDVGNIWELVRPKKSGSPECQPIWTTVNLPHCFNRYDAVDPDANYYQGPGWYQTLLNINQLYHDGRILLEFEGAGQKTDVYVYTQKVASHVGGYDSWNVDITEAVSRFLEDKRSEKFEGKIPLSIRCDNSRDAEMIPSDLSDFNLYGGLYRYVNLVYLPPVSVASLRIDPVISKGKKGIISVTGQFYNPTDVKSASLSLEIIDQSGKIVSVTHEKHLLPLGTFRLDGIEIPKPVVWDVANPYLYTCRLTVSDGKQKFEAVERFGFRTYEFQKKGPFFLNGRRVLLKGTHRHEDHAGVGSAMTESQMKQEILLMKQMGVNFIRLGHYQQSEIILNLCDEMGILVWEEIPWCRGGLGGVAYQQQAKRMLSNMIAQHYNHPSVIIWGLGNENDWPNDFPDFDKTKIRGFMSELNDLSHHLDANRMTAIRRCPFCSDIVDVYSPSIWAGWYRGTFMDYKKISYDEMNKVNHFLHVEWGGDSHAGRHDEVIEGNWQGESYLKAWSKKKRDWSESYIVRLVDWHLKEQENMPWLTGAAAWTFKDFSTPVRPNNPVPYVNQKGMIERDFSKKEVYYVFQSYWTDKPMIHIYGHNWPVRWGEEGSEQEVLVYSNCKEVELFLNGKSLGVKKRNSQDFPAAGLHWHPVFREGKNILKATSHGKQILEDELSFDYQTRKWGKPRRLVISSTDLGNDKVEVEVWMVDKDGVKCLDATSFVHFDLTGDGELIQNMGTSTGSRKIQAQNGHARIHMYKHKGCSYVSVKVKGLPSAFIQIK